MKYTVEETRMGAEEADDAWGKTVVVGIKMEAESRELLTWALVKAVNSGDRVIALHVLPSAAAEVSDTDGKPSSLISLAKAFDAVLAVYEGFCNLKQVDLKLKVRQGSSIRKILVEEASSVSASKLILGVAKGHHGICSSSTSVAKYCTKKLSRGCLVLAIDNGKIIFQKEGSKCPYAFFQKNLSTKRDKLRGEHGKLVNTENPVSYGQLTSPGNRLTCEMNRENEPNTFSTLAALGAEELPVHEPVNESEKEISLALVSLKKHESSMGCVSILTRDFPDVKPGWPLIRRVFSTRKSNASQEKPKASLVQRAIQIPGWYSTSAMVHPDLKPGKAEAAAKCVFDDELLSLRDKYSSMCRFLSYRELMQATSNFSSDKIIGKGGSSTVYLGCLDDGKKVAVKILKPSVDVLKDFLPEIEIITKLHHKNIISLYGFCAENQHLALVYDFLSRGSLEDNLLDKSNHLGWAERYKIAVGVAEALSYLHSNDGTQPVIHRDVKSSNILLSDSFEPQLSDFGLAQWAESPPQNRENTACNDLAGTFGYLAPEYFMYGKIDEKVDIYAFGVVLLELVSGRKPVCNGCPKGQESLVMWAKPSLLSGKFEQLVDSLLGDNYVFDEMERMLLAASLCIRQSPHFRPSAALVLKLLQGDCEAIERARLESRDMLAFNGLDNEAGISSPLIQSHISLALLDVEDDVLSIGSTDQSDNFLTGNVSLEDFLKR
ncbi:hypothetical protein HPP92_004041 [Vanilla planifolia]|uniref:Protein kinase domain-containing protein n=1 Tax=Vanilla planifolia TaxID=51239 RepID=A0A835S948_VANPL|nr:hypothetical protein HPP92_004041 [Vanilla planifolia]